jgi:hypothetical protein
MIVLLNSHDTSSPHFERRHIQETLLEKIAYFQCFRRFREYTADIPEIVVAPPDVSLEKTHIWKQWFTHLETGSLPAIVANDFHDLYRMYCYVYCGEGQHFEELMTMINNNLPQLNLSELSLEGYYSVMKLPVLPENLFRFPSEIEKQPLYLEFGALFRKIRDWGAMCQWASSLLPFPESVSRWSVLPVEKVTDPTPLMQRVTFGLWQHIVPFLCRDFFWSGGSVVWSQFISHDAPKPDMDIDLFCTDVDIARKFIHYLESQFPGRMFYLQDASVCTIIVLDIPCAIQLIFHSPENENSPWKIVHAFDMDYVQVYSTDGLTLQATPACLESWEKRVVKRCNPQLRSDRVEKAMEKGFTIQCPHTVVQHFKSRLDYFYPTSGYSQEYNVNILRKMHPLRTITTGHQELKHLTNFSKDYQLITISLDDIRNHIKDVRWSPSNNLSHCIQFQVRWASCPFGIQPNYLDQYHNNPSVSPIMKLEVQLTPEQRQLLCQVDDHLCSEILLAHWVPETQRRSLKRLKDRVYTSSIRVHGKYEPLLRCKVDPHTVYINGQTGQETEYPKKWFVAHVDIQLTKIWTSLSFHSIGPLFVAKRVIYFPVGFQKSFPPRGSLGVMYQCKV